MRWLSHNSACQALRSTLPSVLVSLSREASECGEPVAAGLLNMITQFKFIATLLLLCDILPHLNRLSCMFQSADLDLSLIQPQILATLITNRFPDAGIISAFSIFDPLKLPASEERAQQERYGESSLNTLVEHYGSGTSPIVSSLDAKNEWEVFVIYVHDSKLQKFQNEGCSSAVSFK